MKFNDLEIKEEIKLAIRDLGFEDATEIQAAAIPVGCTGKDVMGQAMTGTGKTIAFLIPILNQIEKNGDVQSLVLAPTRELAVQITEEVKKLSKYLPYDVLAVYGGDPIDRQITMLKKNRPQIVVGTPGRVLDLIKRKKLKLHTVNFFVLDEVDEMLNMGFIDDVIEIERQMMKTKQTLFFSATLDGKIKDVARKFLNEPEIIKISSKSLTVDKVEQFYAVCKDAKKFQVLKNVIDYKGNEKTIIFTQTKRKADEVYEFMHDNGYKVDKIHGDLTQKQRLSTIDRFKKGRLNYIVATDVVARGIDIEGVELVINLELPQDIEYYIHRIGRTGRGNAEKGESITIVSPRVYDREFRHYSKRLSCTINEFKAPNEDEIVSKLQQKHYEDIMSNVGLKDIEQSYYDFSDMFSGEDARVILAIVFSKMYPELSIKERKVKMEKMQDRSGGNRSRGGNRSSGGNRFGDRNRSGGGNRSRNDRYKKDSGNRSSNNRGGQRRKPKND